MAFHDSSMLLRLKFASFELIDCFIKLSWRLRQWPSLLFRQLALLNFPLLLACLDVDLKTVCAILATAKQRVDNIKKKVI